MSLRDDVSVMSLAPAPAPSSQPLFVMLIYAPERSWPRNRKKDRTELTITTIFLSSFELVTFAVLRMGGRAVERGHS